MTPPSTTAPVPTPQPATTALPAPSTTAGTVAPASVPTTNGAPRLDGGDWISIVAVFVSIVALAYARRATTANEAMAVEARAANALVRQHRQEDQNREAATAAATTTARNEQARVAATQITVQYRLNAGIDVIISNDSSRTVRDVRLVQLVGEHPGWRWATNPNIFMGNSPTHARLAVGDHEDIACVFYDEQNVLQRDNGKGVGSLVRFTDADGQRWEIGDDAGPRQVASDDSDLAAPVTP